MVQQILPITLPKKLAAGDVKRAKSKELGLKPFIVGLGAALVVGLVSFVAIAVLGAFVTY